MALLDVVVPELLLLARRQVYQMRTSSSGIWQRPKRADHLPRSLSLTYVHDLFVEQYLTTQQIFVNCIYLSSKIPNFVDLKSLDTPERKLSVVCDVSADTTCVYEYLVACVDTDSRTGTQTTPSQFTQSLLHLTSRLYP